MIKISYPHNMEENHLIKLDYSGMEILTKLEELVLIAVLQLKEQAFTG